MNTRSAAPRNARELSKSYKTADGCKADWTKAQLLPEGLTGRVVPVSHRTSYMGRLRLPPSYIVNRKCDASVLSKRVSNAFASLTKNIT